MLVLGLARSGKAATAALERRGVEVVGADRELGNDGDPALLDGVELIVKSPGVPREAPLVAEAGRRGIPIWSEVELGYRLLEPRLVGVTGTNGKTTTATPRRSSASTAAFPERASPSTSTRCGSSLSGTR